MPATNMLNGKAFEYACIKAIESRMRYLSKSVRIEESKAFFTTQQSYNQLPEPARKNLDKAADTAVRMIFPMEPRLENGTDTLFLAINTDAIAMGEDGDVRDVLCVRYDEDWAIGISCKHNHEALKHPRITEDMDFGSDWLGLPCGSDFRMEMSEIITPLSDMGRQGVLWNTVADKKEKYYLPILEAYRKEIQRLCSDHSEAPSKILSYFFGSRDFYKVIAKERNRTTTIEGFNMHGTLSAPYGRLRALTKIAQVKFPDRLFDISIKTNSKTTLLLTFDQGWTVSMRLHNKDKIVRPTSLAWDVQLVGLPTGTYVNTHAWDES